MNVEEGGGKKKKTVDTVSAKAIKNEKSRPTLEKPVFLTLRFTRERHLLNEDEGP